MDLSYGVQYLLLICWEHDVILRKGDGPFMCQERVHPLAALSVLWMVIPVSTSRCLLTSRTCSKGFHLMVALLDPWVVVPVATSGALLKSDGS